MRLYEKFACILIILSFCNSDILASEEQGKQYLFAGPLEPGEKGDICPSIFWPN